MSDPVEVLAEIAKFNASHREREWRKKELEKVRHGHDFGYNRECICGLRERDYITKPDSRTVCQGPIYNLEALTRNGGVGNNLGGDS
jgi:hypothetical protein